MHILFNGTGRLGNQLFQLNGVDSATKEIKKRKFILLNMPSINECLDTTLVLNIINNKIIVKLFDKYLCYVLNFLRKIRIIGSIYCSFDHYNGYKLENHYFLKKGIFPFIWIPTFYFQKAELAKNVSFSIKETHIHKAHMFLDSLPKKKNFVFVHIRKTDYITFDVLGKTGADLPLSYYHRATKIFTETINNPFFIFLTDDSEYVLHNFPNLSEKAISNLDQYGDLALMSLCEYGILSNSSFSWWGAFFMKNRKKVIAPRYWLGFKSQIEYPSGIIAPWMDVIDVE